jgi:tRNA-uridine 2-sulfurtransferase
LERDVADARAVATQLGIPFYVWNFEREYRDKVLEYFYAEYAAGRTPNPDVMCNREIKFKLFLDRALKLGADYIATGHYAQIIKKDETHHLLKGIDKSKDQSYFLCLLGQKELSHALFPLGAMAKTEVRVIASERKLVNATKRDSQGLCFVGQVDIRDFLKERLKPNPGKIVNVEGQVLGEHEGVAFYTLGQRKEIGNLPGGPYYVVDKDLVKNELVVSSDPSEPLLWRQECLIDNLSWVNQEITLPADYEVIIRYHHEPTRAHLSKVDKDKIKISFAKPERAITPGQLAVICIGEELLGAGIIL